MQKEIVLAIAISLSLMAIGITAGTTIPDFTYQSYTDRPGNFALTDYATVSGYNSFQASTLANNGGVDEMTKVTALPVDMCLGAPEEHSYQSAYMEFTKGGTNVDPAVQETVSSDITVGATSTTTIPTINSDGTLSGAADERYDLFSSTVGGVAGTPVTTTKNGVTSLTGITDDYSRQVFGSVKSVQDDYIGATGADSAGTNDKILTSYTTASLPAETSAPSAYVQFDWTDVRGFDMDGTNSGQWTIQNSINYAMVPIAFNEQFK